MLENLEGFEWNEGNSNKNWHLHGVTNSECEEVFFNLPLIIAADEKYSDSEDRFFALGRTESNRWLFLAFAVRNRLVRVISAREMTKSERRKYYEKIKRDTEI
ncbi:MAG: BrnT family toxin [Acidobacteriota bacterium]